MPPEVLIEHRYPAALAFLRAHGGHSLAVLHDLLARAERRGGALVARASTREIADRLQFLSKDTVHRALRQLARAGVIEVLERRSGSSFAPTTYVVHLADSGITVLQDGRSA
ncbi:MAG: winged helix-turn-helix domain-containing protein [Acidimicrobiales bacterium]